jgi:hypothetical protein
LGGKRVAEVQEAESEEQVKAARHGCDLRETLCKESYADARVPIELRMFKDSGSSVRK